MNDPILVLNAGSSSLKFSLLACGGAGLQPLLAGRVEGLHVTPRFVVKDAAGKTLDQCRWQRSQQIDHDGALAHVLDWLDANRSRVGRLAAVGHRVVHGGAEFGSAVRVDAAIVDKLQQFVPLAPLHQPHNLSPMRLLLAQRPGLAQVACFDTAMHRSNPGVAQMFALPMATRCGAVDPGVMLYLIDELGMDSRAIEKLIYHESGLLGVSGVSSDMRELLASDAPRARLAVELFVYRAARELGSLAAALGGLDAIVFTAGIGEHAAPVRAMICRAAAWLGVELDEAANAAHGPRISTAASRTRAWVIATNEELVIARHTRDLLAAL